MSVSITAVRPFMAAGSLVAVSGTASVDEALAAQLVNNGDATYTVTPDPSVPPPADHQHSTDQVQWDVADAIVNAATDAATDGATNAATNLANDATGTAIATAYNDLATKYNALATKYNAAMVKYNAAATKLNAVLAALRANGIVTE